MNDGQITKENFMEVLSKAGDEYLVENKSTSTATLNSDKEGAITTANDINGEIYVTNLTKYPNIKVEVSRNFEVKSKVETGNNSASGNGNSSTGGNGSGTTPTKIEDLDLTKADIGITTKSGAPSYNNPIIPYGFRAVDHSIDETISEEANWFSEEGWKKGLVIEDREGNQFVWIAVDGEEVGLDLDDEKLDTTWASKVEKYGGYYIGRYKSSIEDAKCIIKAGKIPKNYITYKSSEEYAAKMDQEYGYCGVYTHLTNRQTWTAARKFIKAYSGTSDFDTITDDMFCNITNINSGILEWSGEYRSWTNHSGYAARGGSISSYGVEGSETYYYCSCHSSSSDNVGFRCALYW